MIDLRIRSYKKELLDSADIPFEDIRQNMRELNTINRLLGGHKITINGIRQFYKGFYSNNNLSICEIGCGGGDNLQAISNWAKKHAVNVTFTGIDINSACIEFAKQQYPLLPVKWICNDYALTEFNEDKPAVIYSSLFCHHFDEQTLVKMLQWMKINSRQGFFINDLHRHPLAYYSIKWITRLFSGSYLVKHDAPLSVARGFTKPGWIKVLNSAGISDYKIQWKWAFRYLIVCKNEH